MEVSVLISIVTFNSEKFIETCLNGIAQQTVRGYHLLLLDNCSNDTTIQRIWQHSQDMNVTMNRLDKNVGFAAAHNININSAIRDHSPLFILVLNPDVYLSRDYIEKILSVFDKDQRLGSATGKLIRTSIEDFRRFDFEPPKYIDSRVIDSTGLFFTPALRHWDRGIGEKDIGQFEREEYIFGVSGAAAFYRTDMLEDIKVGGEYFDEGFFAYREDADLSWRAQIYGWKASYVPSAVGFHVRHVLPGKRIQHSSAINMHSVKNRFLMRIKNMDLITFLKCLPFMLIRDIQVVLYVLLFERSSIPGLRFIVSYYKVYWAKRKEIFLKRRVNSFYIANRFNFRPKGSPIIT